MEKLLAKNPDKVFDLLVERLTFERAGVRLYDALLKKMPSSGIFHPMIGSLREHRDQEKEHGEWLEAQIRDIGREPNDRTDLSQLTERESKGIEEIILGADTEMTHLLHALLAAELVDNAGWDLLVSLADEAGDGKARRAFKRRLHEEEEHLFFMRRAVERLALRTVLGEKVSLPSWP